MQQTEAENFPSNVVPTLCILHKQPQKLTKASKAPPICFPEKITETLKESKDCNFKLACGSQHPEEMLGNFTTKFVLLSKFEYTTNI
jgi:hypothetical protein